MTKPTLRQWHQEPTPPITYDYNHPSLSKGLTGGDTPEILQPPFPMIDLASFWTPFCMVFNRGKNVLTGS